MLTVVEADAADAADFRGGERGEEGLDRVGCAGWVARRDESGAAEDGDGDGSVVVGGEADVEGGVKWLAEEDAVG